MSPILTHLALAASLLLPLPEPARVADAPSVRLTVLSEATGESLAGITVVRTASLSWTATVRSANVKAGDRVIEGGVSPVTIHPQDDQLRSVDAIFFVHSPGFAWEPIHLDLTRGGEREIRLERSGDVAIQISGEPLEKPSILRLRNSASATREACCVALEVSTAQLHEVTGLAPGNYVASLERSDEFGRSVELGATQVTVVAGKRASFELPIAKLPAAEPLLAPLAGALSLPPEWDFRSYDFSARLSESVVSPDHRRRILEKSELRPDGNERDAWRFDFGALTPGPYELQFMHSTTWTELVFTQIVQLGPAGLTNARMELPLPAQVSVQVLDAQTEQLASVLRVDWQTAPESRQVSSSGYLTDMARNGKPFEFRASPGVTSIRCSAPGYTQGAQEFEVQPGANEFTLRLERDCPLLIWFLDGETVVPVSERSWPLVVEHLDGHGCLEYAQYGLASHVTTALSEPGRYRLVMPSLPEFEPVPNQTVTVKRGSRTELVIQLVRRR